MTVFEGSFKPPVIGADEVPIKITGLGKCELTSDGLNIQGFKHTPKVSSSLLFILFFVAFFGIILLRVVWPGIPTWLNVLPLGVVVAPYLRGQGSDHQDEPIELWVPWEYVAGAKLEKISPAVIIRIKKYRYKNECYKGALYFHPVNESDEFLKALQEHGVQCKP
ncbi:hypothetical protein [Acaryochloris sp. IP29b_bin.148]|uniref:hypothetical protein n=1 Tax=Acaryochloris sp. IP29b_bin.148 TaxID=2969218 RepID=UPI002625D136|nr:hypothetical protein [Acaryochloris sp. IP29b_bin.148]